MLVPKADCKVPCCAISKKKKKEKKKCQCCGGRRALPAWKKQGGEKKSYTLYVIADDYAGDLAFLDHELEVKIPYK